MAGNSELPCRARIESQAKLSPDVEPSGVAYQNRAFAQAGRRPTPFRQIALCAAFRRSYCPLSTAQAVLPFPQMPSYAQ